MDKIGKHRSRRSPRGPQDESPFVLRLRHMNQRLENILRLGVAAASRGDTQSEIQYSAEADHLSATIKRMEFLLSRSQS